MEERSVGFRVKRKNQIRLKIFFRIHIQQCQFPLPFTTLIYIENKLNGSSCPT